METDGASDGKQKKRRGPKRKRGVIEFDDMYGGKRRSARVRRWGYLIRESSVAVIHSTLHYAQVHCKFILLQSILLQVFFWILDCIRLGFLNKSVLGNA